MRGALGFPNKSANLDLLRAGAVMAVLADHVAATCGIGKQYGFFDLGQLGVLFFFVHTSLVLLLSLERQHTAKNGFFGVLAFYVRRIFRIYPLSIISVLAVCIFHVPATPWAQWRPPGVKAVLSSLLLVSNITGADPVLGPLWSLPLELQMYLVLPAVFLLLRRASKRRLAMVWLGSVAAGSLQIYLGNTGHAGMWRFTVAAYAPCFISGAVAWRLMASKRTARLSSVLWPVGAATVGGAFLLWQTFSHSTQRYPAYRGWICCLAIGLTLPLCRDCSNIFVNRVAGIIAKYSYGIYLAQCFVLWAALVVLRNWSLTARVALAAALLCAIPVVAFHLIEEPAIRLAARLAANIPEWRFTRSLAALAAATGQVNASPYGAELVQQEEDLRV